MVLQSTTAQAASLLQYSLPHSLSFIAEIEQDGTRLPSEEDMLEFVNGRVEDIAAAREILRQFMGEQDQFFERSPTVTCLSFKHPELFA